MARREEGYRGAGMRRSDHITQEPLMTVPVGASSRSIATKLSLWPLGHEAEGGTVVFGR